MNRIIIKPFGILLLCCIIISITARTGGSPEPAAAAPSAANYSISGHVTDSSGKPLSGVSVQATPRMKTPLVLVHGYLGFGKDAYTDLCISGNTLPYHYSGDPNPNKDTDYSSVGDGVGGRNRKYFDQAPQRFDAMGYDVWIVHVASGPTDKEQQVITPPLAKNGACLASQLEYLHVMNPLPVTLVAHSMGGAVSRACLSIVNKKIANCHMVNRLVTLGTPHAGLPGSFEFGVDIKQQPGLFELIGNRIVTFNRDNPMNRSKGITFMVGDWVWLNGGDIVVGKYSGLGWTDPQGNTNPKGWDTNYCNPAVRACDPPKRYWTNELHTDYFKDKNSSASVAVQCIKWVFGGANGTPPSSCNLAEPSGVGSAESALLSTDLQTTSILTGTIGAAEQATRSLQVDTTDSSIFKVAANGNVTMTLTQPGGQVIDYAYAQANQGVVSYAIIPGGPGSFDQVAYVFTDTIPGVWQITLSNAFTDSVAYQTFAQLESSRSLKVAANAEDLTIGSMATFTATLANDSANITGAVVTMTLARADGAYDTLILAHQGNGLYTGTYTVPNVPGYLLATGTATGTDNGIAFSRQESLVLAIAPQTAQLLGAYTEQAIDEDNNSLYESLDLQVAINSTIAGPVMLFGELWAGDQYIATTQSYTDVVPGEQTLTLSFTGADIYKAQQDGPYTLTNLTLYDLNYGSIAVFDIQNAYTTAAYSFRNFDKGENLNIYLPLVMSNDSSLSTGQTIQALNSYNTQTDANGNYTLTNIPPGNYYVRAFKIYRTFTPASRILTIPPGNTFMNFIRDDMILIPSGPFKMGCDPTHNGGYSCDSRNLPLHIVYLFAYKIDKNETTNAQYAQCVEMGPCKPPGLIESETRDWYYGNPLFDNYPVMWVSWGEANTYCNWAGKRLPTEAEWEKAARGTSVRAFPWGDQSPNCTLANYDDYYGTGNECVGDTSQVGSYPAGASPYGVMDMAGNVSEWVNDWYKSNYYSISPLLDPRGPTNGIQKVIRGSTYGHRVEYLMMANRNYQDPTLRSHYGFRCVANP